MEKEKKVENIEDLRNDLLRIYTDLRSGKIGLREAKEQANVSGKIISSAKLQLEYNNFTKSASRIEFLEIKPSENEKAQQQSETNL